MSGDTLLLADVPKILLKGTFNEIKLLSCCFGFQGLFPRQKKLYGKLLVVKPSPTTHCDPVLENPLGIKIPFFPVTSQSWNIKLSTEHGHKII